MASSESHRCSKQLPQRLTDGFLQLYVAAGCVAFTCFTLIIIISWRPVRTRFYEFFLVSHIVLVAFGLVFLLLHRMEYWPFFAAGITLWSFDRVVRFFRLVLLNKLWRTFYGTCFQENVARFEALSNGALLRVTMKRQVCLRCSFISEEDMLKVSAHQYGWKAGKHAHIMMPTVSRFPWGGSF